jgi:hypothetical protein
MVEQSIANGEQLVRWEVLAGDLKVQTMRYDLPPGATVRAVTVEHAGVVEVATLAQQDGTAKIELAETLRLAPGQPLVVRLAVE